MSKLPAVPKGDDMAANEFSDLPFALAAIAPKGAWRKARDVLTNQFFGVARIDD